MLVVSDLPGMKRRYIMLEGVVDSPDTIIEDSHCNFGNSFGALA